MPGTSSGPPTPTVSPSQIGVVDMESGLADSFYQAGITVAPGAGVVVGGTLTPGIAGVYEVLVDAGYLGATAPAAADAANMAFQKTSANFGSGTLPVPVAVGLNTFGPFRVTLNATDTLRVIAIGAGTALVNYAASIVARRVA